MRAKILFTLADHDEFCTAAPNKNGRILNKTESLHGPRKTCKMSRRSPMFAGFGSKTCQSTPSVESTGTRQNQAEEACWHEATA